MAQQREFFVSFEGELSDQDRQTLTRPGWKLYENGIGSTAAFRGEVPADAPVTWRQIVRLSSSEGTDAKRLVVEALGREPEALRVDEGRRPVLQQDSPRHFELIAHARQLMQERRYDFAVIAAQTACEVYVEATIGDLLERRRLGPLGDAISEALVTSFSLRDRRGQALWEALTGERVTQQQWWSSYVEHTERRNKLVHKGAAIDEDEAGRSVEVALRLMAYVHMAWARVLGDLSLIEPWARRRTVFRDGARAHDPRPTPGA